MDSKQDTSPAPDGSQLVDLFRGPVDVRSLALTGLFVLVSLYAMRVARPFLMPVAAAVLLNFLLAPLVAALSRWHVPRKPAAASPAPSATTERARS